MLHPDNSSSIIDMEKLIDDFIQNEIDFQIELEHEDNEEIF